MADIITALYVLTGGFAMLVLWAAFTTLALVSTMRKLSSTRHDVDALRYDHDALRTHCVQGHHNVPTHIIDHEHLH